MYFIEKKFDDEIKDIGKVPEKLENTKIFHKVCSYLHMILEQEHKEKWSSRRDKKLREARRQQSKQFIRISKLENKNLLEQKQLNKTSYSRFYSLPQSVDEDRIPELHTSQSNTENKAVENKKLKQKQSDSVHEQVR